MIQKQLTPTPERSTNKSMNTEDKTPESWIEQLLWAYISTYNSYEERTGHSGDAQGKG